MRGPGSDIPTPGGPTKACGGTGPLVPSWLQPPTSTDQALAGTAKEKANPTDLAAFFFSQLYFQPLQEAGRALRGSPRGASGSGAGPAQRSSGPRMSVGGRGQFISVLLLFDVHTSVLFTTK